MPGMPEDEDTQGKQHVLRSSSSESEKYTQESAKPSTQDIEPPCWTDCIPRTEHNALFLNMNFRQTTLGPISEWGPALRAYTTMAFADSRGACIYWGPQRLAIYNEPFADTLEGAHPDLLGHGFSEIMPELGSSIEPVFQHASTSGQTVDVNDIQLFSHRNGYLEETYFLGQFIPLRGDSGLVEGFYNTVLETTGRVLSMRRRRLVDRIVAIEPLSVDVTILKFMEALHTEPNDVTAAVVYTLDVGGTGDIGKLCVQGSIGVPKDHRCLLPEERLETSQHELAPIFREVQETLQPYVLDLEDDACPVSKDLFDGIEWQGFAEPSRTIVICPLATSGNLLGFYVQGTNPRRQSEDVSRGCILDMTTQLAVKLSHAIAKKRAGLREQALKRRATDSENRLRYMAQTAPLGMYQVGPDSEIQWANDQFYEITGHDSAMPGMADFRMTLAPEEREKERVLCEQLLHGAPKAVREIRLNRTWTSPTAQNPSTEPSSAWMLAVTTPLMEEGRVKMLLGYVTDISSQKLAEEVQSRNAEKAEAFLDITSHELRNPLTAITQLADGIAKSSENVLEDQPDAWQTIVNDNVDAAVTILACAAHQKRIIDDVLVLSRLDSQMLSITPTSANLREVASEAIKMFDAVATLHGTEVSATRGHDSPELQHVDHVFLDTSRLMQVIMNLISNAIKFTAPRDTRKVEIIYGVLAERPTHIKTRFGDLVWIPPVDVARSSTELVDLKEGEKKLYAYFLVHDTGPGLTSEEIQRLFKRFSQATTKTNVTYGGSGLGLYICRELSEKQGGRVGVASIEGQGSVFGFFLRTKAITAAEKTPASTDENKSPIPYSRREGFHVLLVEDNIVNQRVLAKQLQRANCTVVVANHGLEALTILGQTDEWHKAASKDPTSDECKASKPFDVVLMDIEMPVMDGLECTKRIRGLETGTTRRLPIIAVTANARQEQQDKVLAAGVDGILPKPFTVNVLVSKIAEYAS